MVEKGDRLIGRYTGDIRGPLMICLAGMHGNEHAGVKALELVFKMLEVEPITNPDFEFKGRITGFIGNVSAYAKKDRFVETDLNRIWTPAIIQEIIHKPMDELDSEYRELRELMRAVNLEIDSYNPTKIIVLDLHTTSCIGGIFSIVRDDRESVEFGIELHAPVIRGMLKGLDGTTLHYFNRKYFDIPITSITFESGEHDEPMSVNRAIAAIINCMRTSGNVMAEHVENHHDKLLIKHSKNLPKICQLIYGHQIKPEDNFRMQPGYINFSRVHQGDVLATDSNGPIKAKCDGILLMPLYQKQGTDGFFIIEKSDPKFLEDILGKSQRSSSR